MILTAETLLTTGKSAGVIVNMTEVHSDTGRGRKAGALTSLESPAGYLDVDVVDVVDVDVVVVGIGYGVDVVEVARQEEASCYKYCQQESQQWSPPDEVRAGREICPGYHLPCWPGLWAAGCRGNPGRRASPSCGGRGSPAGAETSGW